MGSEMCIRDRFSVAKVLRSFSPLSSSITRSDLNFALKFLLFLDMTLTPFLCIDLSISDSLRSVRKSVLIYETIIFRAVCVFKTFASSAGEVVVSASIRIWT